jgi:hypothetical protein
MAPEKFKLPNPHIQANIYYFSPQEGGISKAILSGYRGQVRINGNDWDAGQEFIDKTTCYPGEKVDVLIQFATAHNLLTLFPGLKFKIAEGPKVIGLGVITKLVDPLLGYRSKSKILYAKIDQILWENWDPIGINDETAASGEYETYVPKLYALKSNDADIETITNHLLKIEIKRMGLAGDIENCRKVALEILNA